MRLLITLALLESAAAAALRRQHLQSVHAAGQCWEWLWTGHANASTIGKAVEVDLKNFAFAANRFEGSGHFGYYIDTPNGLDVGSVQRNQAELTSATEMPGASSPLALHFADMNAAASAATSDKFIITEHLSNIKETGFATAIERAAAQIKPRSMGCTRVASYSGHGYNFNGIGYGEHKFSPWDGFFEPIRRVFGGPVDLLGLDTCRMANYMLLGELEGTANMVLAHQHVGLFSPQYGSWAWDKIPLADSTDVKSFATQLITETINRGDRAGMSLLDMRKFGAFSESFGKLLDWYQPRLKSEIGKLIQARRQSVELTGPSLYEPNNGGMIVDLESFLGALQKLIPKDDKEPQSLISETIRTKREVVIAEQHDPSNNGLTGMSLWFMKPEDKGWNKELLGEIRRKLTRTSGGRWAEFLEAYYVEADRTTLSEADKHKIVTPRE